MFMVGDNLYLPEDMNWKEIPEGFTGVVRFINYPESVYYFQDGEFHRPPKEGPAVKLEAFIEYFVHGKHHREDAPARIWSDGLGEWWWDGMFYGFDKETPYIMPEGFPAMLLTKEG